MSILPPVTTPEDLAAHTGWPARRIRRLARQLGDCLLSGHSMLLTEAEVHGKSRTQRKFHWNQGMQGMTGTEKQEQTTMNEHETSAPIRAKSAQSGSTSVLLTQIRGKVRRTPEGIEKQQSELLGAEIKNEVPADFLKSHVALMEGRPLPVISCLADHAPHIWATLAADPGKGA